MRQDSLLDSYYALSQGFVSSIGAGETKEAFYSISII